MKMMCIKDDWKWAGSGKDYTPKDPIYGEVVTVINRMEHEGTLIYKLDGYAEWYNSKYFIPLSSIDEKEFVREYNTVKI